MSQAEHDVIADPASRTTRRGAVQHWSRTIIPTAREAPADAETPSHIFLVRAGYIRRVGAGVYNYLPLGQRVLARISSIVREEMDRAGASELLLPALMPIELLAPTGRDADYGDLLFKLEDRHGRTAFLGPTHEEVITDLVRLSLTSYKQFPVNLYQIQSKFRDEFRPRAGLLRAREFVMKDAYSFHLEVDGPGGLGETYRAMYDAYVRIFTRCGLDFTVVEAEAGPIGGSASHEFMVNCASGEDVILVCPESGYAANIEKAEIGERPWSFDAPAEQELEKVHTPGMPGIEGVADFLGVRPDQMLKTIVFQPAGKATDAGDRPDWILAVVRGDHDVNEGKVREAVGFPVALADEKAARAAGFAIGYVSPLMQARTQRTAMVIDPDATGGGAWATGADEPDHHVRGFNWGRELGAVLTGGKEGGGGSGYVKLADIRNAEVGDPSPRAAGAKLEARRGIEVGHIFKLGTKYSDAMGLTVLDREQKKRSVVMGCYGIGVSRIIAAAAEMSHDEAGLRWPAALAPYHVLITVMKPDVPEHAACADRLTEQLAGHGVDVLIDDRAERPGVKFNDADLIGLPVRLTVGQKALDEGGVELKLRSEDGKGSLVPMADVVARCLRAIG